MPNLYMSLLETFVMDNGELVHNLVVVQDMKGESAFFPKMNEPLRTNISKELCDLLFSPAQKNYYAIAHNFPVTMT